MEYHQIGYRKSDLVRLDIKINNEVKHHCFETKLLILSAVCPVACVLQQPEERPMHGTDLISMLYPVQFSNKVCACNHGLCMC